MSAPAPICPLGARSVGSEARFVVSRPDSPCPESGLSSLASDSLAPLEDGVVYHTYSAYERGLDAVWGMYQLLDRAPLGRNEPGLWIRRRDEYPRPP